MLDIALRAIKDGLMNFLLFLIPPFVSPNQLTAIGLLAGLASAYFCSQNQYSYALLAWVSNRFLDGIDGTVARKRNLQSDFGGYIDIVFDFIVYCAVPFGIAFQKDQREMYLICVYMISTFCVNAVAQFYMSAILEKLALGAKAKNEKTTVTMPPALIEGTETVIFFTLFILYHEQAFLLFSIFSIGVTINVLQRLYNAHYSLKEKTN